MFLISMCVIGILSKCVLHHDPELDLGRTGSEVQAHSSSLPRSLYEYKRPGMFDTIEW